MVSQIYPTERQLNKANSFDTEAPSFYIDMYEGDQKVRGKVLLNRIGFIVCNENS